MNSDSSEQPLLASTWAELRRRKVVRVAIAYGVVAWVVLQLGEITFEPLGLPPWFLTWTILVVILAFPVVLVLAWVFDRGESGLIIDRAGPAYRGPARVFAVVLVVMTVAALGWWLTDVYRDPGVDEPTAAWLPAPTRSSERPASSIAVLPFQDMSPEGDQGWFADGIAEELLDRLARLDGLWVAARTSSFALRDRDLDVTRIGQLLNVGLVLEGSVRKAGGRLRITAQLIDSNNGYHLWSETYERAEKDIFELQDEITQEIVEQLRARIPGLVTATPDALAKAATGIAETRDLQAHELYLQGRLYWRQRTPSSLARAASLFEQALERDPGFARAWCGLADTHLLLADYGAIAMTTAIERAEPAIVQALTLAPGLGEAWASLGLLRSLAGQLDAAEGNLLEAIRLDPNYEMALMWLGGVYARQGKFAARAEVLERARALSPLDPAINVNLANSVHVRGDADGARAILMRLLEITPDSNLVRRTLADIERQSGRLVDALRQVNLAWRQDPEAPSSIASLVAVLVALQRFEEADRMIRQLPAQSPIRPLLELTVLVHRDRGAPLPLELQARIDQILESEEPLSDQQRPQLQMAALSEYWRQHGDRERVLRILARITATRDGAPLNSDQMEFAQIQLLVLREAGRDDEASALRTQILQSADYLIGQGVSGPMVEYSIAAWQAIDGDPRAAIDGLARAIDIGFCETWLLSTDPRWRGLADQPDFRRLHQGLLDHVAAEREASLAVATY